MLTMLDESLVPFGLATRELLLGDDEIAAHAEALDDGRDAPASRSARPVDLQDDEIASHLEEGEMLFELASYRPGRGRRPLRH